jgi:HD-GYP domain-containing protein (c-di-GMP phosphodiesterase class II)
MSSSDVLQLADGQLCGCPVCTRPLPLRLARANEEPSPWQCLGCGAVLSAIFVPESPAEWHKHVKRSQPAGRRAPKIAARGSGRKALPPQLDVRCVWESDLSRDLDAQIDSGSFLLMPDQRAPLIEQTSVRGNEPYDRARMDTLVDEHQHAVRQVNEQFCGLVRHRPMQLSSLRQTVSAMLQHFRADRDLYVCLGSSTTGTDYPGRHCLHVAMLAMAMGASLGYDEPKLIDLSLGCLLHDAGMLQILGEEVHSSRALSRQQYQVIAAHPLHTCELLRPYLERVSPITRMVVYQMHERSNGSGYPRGRCQHEIHELARVAALADAYVALCSPRPHRPAMMPYFAVVSLLREIHENRFDAAVMRGLLKTISLFPIGSYVELGDGRTGKVIRSNTDRYDRPIVEVLRGKRSDPDIVDMALAPDLYSPRAVEPLRDE